MAVTCVVCETRTGNSPANPPKSFASVGYPRVCRHCATNHAWCPSCHEVYEAEREWLGPYARRDTIARYLILPCSTCSTTPLEPRLPCSTPACTGTVKINGFAGHNKVDLYGRAYCSTCAASRNFCASCGKVSVHVTDATKNTYCTVCTGAHPQWFPFATVDEWEPYHHPSCVCTACRRYRTDNPTVREDFQDEGYVTCHSCGDETVYDAEGGMETEDGRYCCHLCTMISPPPVCKTCHRHYYTLGPDQLRCQGCIDPTTYYQCNVGCRGAWFRRGSPCNCDKVYPWNYTPSTFTFLTSPKEPKVKRPIYMGFELEVEAMVGDATRKGGAEWLHSNIPWAYPVHDGTLINRGQGGFEIVTHPFTLPWLRQEWESMASAFSTLSSMGFRSWETKRCGMHIHISRNAMSDAHQLKFIRFIYGSTNLCLAIGQRNYNDPYLARYAPFHGEDRARLLQKVRAYANPGVESHYTAISTNKTHTLEARWFRGTLNPDSILKNLEFIHSICTFTGIYGMTSANEANYITWLRDRNHPNQYPTLLKFLEHNYITRR